MKRKIFNTIVITALIINSIFPILTPRNVHAAGVSCADVVPREAQSKCATAVSVCGKMTDTDARKKCEENIQAKIDECKSLGTTTQKETCFREKFGIAKQDPDEAIKQKREECEKKGGQFYVEQVHSDGTVSYGCRTSSDNPNGNPSNADAAILTECASIEKGGGEGIKCVVITVINIMSVLVGIVGIIGIVVVGIQYLTAGGNEEQTRKAKRRLFEIIIGIALYFVTAALLNWLLPEFNPDTNNTSLIPSIIAIIGG